MSKKRKRNDKAPSAANKKALRMTVRYVLMILAYEAIVIFLALLYMIGIEIFRMDSPGIYDFLKLFVIPLAVAFSAVGCCYISYRFMRRPMEYLDDVAGAARQLAHLSESPVVLPQELADIQDDLNNAREQAVKSMKAAREAEERKNDLLVYLAHDLKTPLTSVIGYLALIENEPQISVETIIRYTGIARKKAERLEELINEFFEITRFRTGKLILEPGRTNLSRMLMQITNEFRPILAEKGLEWDLRIPENVEMICDRDKLERAVDNLIRNAVLYSYENTKIQCSLSESGTDIQIRVQNRGKTIPPEKLELIFEQFYRLDASRSGDAGGAGLGLAIAREITQLHGGTITAESADETIQFEIRLPKDCQKIV